MKTTIKFLFTATFCAFSSFASAQTADEILNLLSEQARDYNTIEASYSSVLVDLKNDFKEEMSGDILIEGSSFNLSPLDSPGHCSAYLG